MSKEEKNIDSLFKKQLDEFECSPTDASWKFLKMKMKHSALKKGLILVFSSIIAVTLIVSSFFFFKNESAQEIKYKQSEKDIPLFINRVSKTQQKETPSKIDNETRTITHEEVSSSESKIESLDLVEKEDGKLQLSKSIVSTTINKVKIKEEFTVNKSRLDYLNSDFDDYAPVIKPNANFMYFTSRRPITKREIRRGEGKERIYYAERDGKGWTIPKMAKNPVNSEGNFNSAVSLTQDGQTLFIYRDDFHGNGDIFASSLKNGTWSEPEALPEPINSEFHESAISMSSNGSKLFFTSNRPGGQGGLDIWYTEKNKSGVWGEAKNLGSHINSNQHEEGVFLHPNDKTLFFSSRRDGGFGGYDIYFTTFENGEWNEPTNLGSKINTENDDVYFMLDVANSEAFLTSSNNSTNQKHLFSFNWSDDLLKQDKEQILSPKIKGEIELINNSYKPNNRASLFLVHDNQVIHKETLEKNLVFDFEVRADNNYELVVFSEGYIPAFEKVSGENLKNNFELNKNIKLSTLKEETSFAFEVFGQKHKNLKSLDIAFASQLISYLNNNKEVSIEIITNENSAYLKRIFEVAGAKNPNISNRLIFIESKDDLIQNEKQNLIHIIKTI